MNRQAIFYAAAGVVSTLTVITLHRLLFDPESFRLTPRKKRAVFFGDSITQHGSNTSGWVASMVQWWFRRVDVINRGFSGYNSRWALMIVNEVVVTEKPDIVFIFFGANDAVDVSVPQHVSLTDYKSNMEHIVLTLKRVRPLHIVGYCILLAYAYWNTNGSLESPPLLFGPHGRDYRRLS